MKFLPFSLALNLGPYEFAMAAGKAEEEEIEYVDVADVTSETERLVFGFVGPDEELEEEYEDEEEDEPEEWDCRAA